MSCAGGQPKGGHAGQAEWIGAGLGWAVKAASLSERGLACSDVGRLLVWWISGGERRGEVNRPGTPC
jgi:hypothetical protein